MRRGENLEVRRGEKVRRSSHREKVRRGRENEKPRRRRDLE